MRHVAANSAMLPDVGDNLGDRGLSRICMRVCGPPRAFLTVSGPLRPWATSPRHKVPDSDAGRPRNRCHNSPDAATRDQSRPAPRCAGPARAVAARRRRLLPRGRGQSSGSERGSAKGGAPGLATLLDVGGRLMRRADAAHRRDLGAGRHSTDPRPSRTPRHPGRPAPPCSVTELGAEQTALADVTV